MAADTTTRSPTVDEITGSFAVPPHGYIPSPMPEQTIMTKENFLKLVVWAIPIIFTAGGLFVSVGAITERQDDQAAEIKAEQARGTKLEADQRVMQGSVQTISSRQEKMETKLESIDWKLNEQHADLRAIGERLGARVSPGGTNRMTEPNP